MPKCTTENPPKVIKLLPTWPNATKNKESNRKAKIANESKTNCLEK